MYYFIAFITGIFIGLMLAGDSLGGINITDNERRRVISLVRRAAAERETAITLWKDGMTVDMVPFPEREW